MKHTKTSSIAYILFYISYLFSPAGSVLNPEEYPNLLAGSFTDGNRFSTGNTLPLVGRPWGFNHWSPQTRHGGRNTGSWWFSGSDQILTWIRCTHQPSPWIGDWGYFMFSPMIGEGNRDPIHFWQPRSATLKPYLMDLTVAPYNIRIELTPTDHGAHVRVTFPAARDYGSKRICFSNLHWDGSGPITPGGGSGASQGVWLSGHSNEVHSERMIVTNFQFRMKVESYEATNVANQDDLSCFRYKSGAHVVTMRIITSLISDKQLNINLQRELSSKFTFEDSLQESKFIWNRLMSRVNVFVDTASLLTAEQERHLTIFYTGLYRALTFPRRLDEMDESGKVVHYSPYDSQGRTFDGYLVTDNGFWDTFRTVYPLLSLLYQDHLGYIIQGWINAYKEGGWLPSWASPGYRNCMVGTFADVVIADAIVKQIPNFDLSQAVEGLKKDAFNPAPRYGGIGKEGLLEYGTLGYLPTESGGEVVSRTLDYGFADYSTAMAFQYLATTSSAAASEVATSKKELLEAANSLMNRAMRASSMLFDGSKGLMVPKDRSGRTSPRFSAIEWGNGYTEGNAWHHSFPPYAISCLYVQGIFGNCQQRSGGQQQQGSSFGLANLYGGKAPLLAKLHQLLEVPSNFQVGSYNQEIHEMTEMRAFAMGQYGHNNQPVHHILYLFALLGEQSMTSQTIHEVLERAYGLDFYAGDEDNGEQGAWYVLSALGLYTVTPGIAQEVLSVPIFPHIRIHRANCQLGDNKSNKNKLLFNLFEYNLHPPTDLKHYLQEEQEQLQKQSHDKEAAGCWFDIITIGARTGRYKTQHILYNEQEHTLPYLLENQVQVAGILQYILEPILESSQSAEGSGEDKEEDWQKQKQTAAYLHSQSDADLDHHRHHGQQQQAAVASQGQGKDDKKASLAASSAFVMTPELGKYIEHKKQHDVHVRLQHHEGPIPISKWYSSLFTIYYLLLLACLGACLANELLRYLLWRYYYSNHSSSNSSLQESDSGFFLLDHSSAASGSSATASSAGGSKQVSLWMILYIRFLRNLPPFLRPTTTGRGSGYTIISGKPQSLTI